MTKKVSELPAASALTGEELLLVVQSGVSKRAAINTFADLTPRGYTGSAGTAGEQGAIGYTGSAGSSGASGFEQTFLLMGA